MTRDKKIQDNLARHYQLMSKLEKEGISRGEASYKALEILFKSNGRMVRGDKEVEK